MWMNKYHVHEVIKRLWWDQQQNWGIRKKEYEIEIENGKMAELLKSHSLITGE